MDKEKKIIVHITDGHSAFDDRIFYKELCSLSKEYVCFELCSTEDGKSLFSMGGEKKRAGVYNGVVVLPFRRIQNNLLFRVIRHFIPKIYFYFYSFILSKEILFTFKENDILPTVIHYHDICLQSVARKLKQKYNCKLIFDSHEFFFSYPFNDGLNKKTCKKSTNVLLQWKRAIKDADFVIGCTKTMDNLISLIRQDDNHGIIYNSSMFPMNIKKRSIEDKDKTVLLHEGAMPFNRGLKLMLEIFRDEVIRSKFQLRIVGSLKNEEKKYFEEKCREYNITEENIYYTGWVSYLDVPIALQGDIGIIFFEKKFNTFYGMPNKLFNYHVVGVPVISTHCAELSDIILQKGTGVIVERDIESVKQGLMNLLENYSKYQHNVLKYQEQFHWNSDEKRLFDIYKKVLN